MATFTINSQKNFVQAPSSKKIFDKAFVFSCALVLIVGGIWGGQKFLIYSLNKQIAEYKQTTDASLGSVQAVDVQEVHNVTSRIAVIEKAEKSNVSSTELLAALERSTIPQVKLTDFEYKAAGDITLSGEVSDYRFLAEQILRYRQEALFATAEVTATGRSESGVITFSLTVPQNQSETVPEPVVAPVGI